MRECYKITDENGAFVKGVREPGQEIDDEIVFNLKSTSHHALVGPCPLCDRAGFVGMKCTCKDDQLAHIACITSNMLHKDDCNPFQFDPIKICKFMHAVTKNDRYIGIEHQMKAQGLLIDRGYDSTLDKPFADPEKGAWTYERHQKLEDCEEDLEMINRDIQRYMEDSFFRTDKKIMLEHLLEVAEGVGWDELHLNARVTIRRYLQDEEESSTTVRREHIKALVQRGLPKEGIPLGLRNFED